jgi:hypothetical protein
MKANELMLDDWVECLDSTHKERVYAQIDAIEESRRCLLVKDGWGNWFLDISHLEPIPLTEDILMKNGFEVHPFGCVWYQEKGIDFQNYIVVHFRRNGEPRKVELCFVNKVSAEVRDINYVHQLQHLLRLCVIKKTIEL